MKRTVALAVLVLAAACRPGEPVPPPTAPSPAEGRLPSDEPMVRIGITVDSTAAVVSAPSAHTLIGPDGREIARGAAGEQWTFRSSNGALRADSDRGNRMGAVRGNVRVRASNDTVQIGARAYQGEALVLPRAEGSVTAINVLAMERYLLGVVPREIGRRPLEEMDAMKAQAVAARTYAIGNLNGRANQGFDFYATVMDQVYGGIEDEDDVVSRAVRETAGEIVTHNGQPILAYYSSTCGGSTAAIEDSWPNRAPLPYLKAVSDRIPGSDEHYCERSSRFRWDQQWTRAELLDVLGETLRAHTRGRVTDVRRIDAVRLASRNESGRATVEVVADGRTHTLRADSIRWTLRVPGTNAILNSSLLFDVETEGNDEGVSALHIHGGGWGHAIGMCQVGAMGRARAGQSYREILGAYYVGTRVEKLY